MLSCYLLVVGAFQKQMRAKQKQSYDERKTLQAQKNPKRRIISWKRMFLYGLGSGTFFINVVYGSCCCHSIHDSLPLQSLGP